MATTAAATKTNWWNGGKSPFNVEYGKLMMWYFLMSDAFTFGAFLISYGTIRFSQNVWADPNVVFNAFPGAGHTNLPLAFVSVMTFILIISSVTMVLAVHAGHNNDKKGVMKWLAWTIVGGLAFLGCQAWEWHHLITGEHVVLMDNHLDVIGQTTRVNPWGQLVNPATVMNALQNTPMAGYPTCTRQNNSTAALRRSTSYGKTTDEKPLHLPPGFSYSPQFMPIKTLVVRWRMKN